MSFDLANKLVIGVASSALFDLRESDAVYRSEGESAYRHYQEQNIDVRLEPGVAFPFVRRLLSLNDLSPNDLLVEVIILSRNDPETGLRVMRSIEQHKLPITRAIFMEGRSPYRFMGALKMSLFLSANRQDVAEALDLGFAAGHVVGSPAQDPEGTDLRVAFDFDGVIADDASETIMMRQGLDAFQANEKQNVDIPMNLGVLADFLRGLNQIQHVEDKFFEQDPEYNRRLHVAIVTARSAPAHARAIRTIQSSGLRVNDGFFLGGIEKTDVLEVLRPHIFFDDKLDNLTGSADTIPSVHIPWGISNEDPDLPEGDADRISS